MIIKGYLLIHSDCIPYESTETVLACSEDKNQLDKIAITKNKEVEETLHRFHLLQQDIETYRTQFDMFQLLNSEYSKKDFDEWIKNNPIPENIEEFVDFEESDSENESEFWVYFNALQEYDLREHYYVRAFESQFPVNNE